MSNPCRFCDYAENETDARVCANCGALFHPLLRIVAFLAACLGFYLLMDAWGSTCDFRLLPYGSHELDIVNSLIYEWRACFAITGMVLIGWANRVRIGRIRPIEWIGELVRTVVSRLPGLVKALLASVVALAALVALGRGLIDSAQKARLYSAVHTGNERALVHLLKHHANPDTIYYNPFYDRTPLIIAIEEHMPAMALVLLRHGAQPDRADSEHRTPLVWAAKEGNLTTVRALIERGAAVNGIPKEDTPLVSAFRPTAGTEKKTSAEIVQLLVDHGADVNRSQYGGVTPLMLAAGEGNAPIVHLLVERGAAIDARSAEGLTPVFEAVRANSVPVLSFLIDRHADFRARNSVGNTALHEAASMGHDEMVRILLDARQEIDVQDDERFTPLMSAALNGQGTTVRLLLSRGADPARKNKEGKTAADEAEFDHHPEIAAMLRKAKAR